MKEIKGLTVSQTQVTSKAGAIRYTITGDIGAVFSVQVVDASSQSKFYNFTTNTFTTSFTSENALSNVVMGKNSTGGTIAIPDTPGGNTYKIMVFADPFFDTKIAGSNNYLLTQTVSQEAGVTVRFSTSSDQDNTNLVGIGAFVGSTTGSSNTASNIEVAFTETLIDSSTGAHGYKWTAPGSTTSDNTLADNLQPKDSDFYVEIATQTNGSGTDSTSMIVDSVSNLVVGMSLVDIADSSDEEQSGTLGVLTYPTITAVNTDTKTLTLSAAPDWGDDKAVKFRAYGSELIRQSIGGIFEFNLIVYPESTYGKGTFGVVYVNGAVSGTEIAIDGNKGVSAGATIIGAGIDSKDGANVISTVHSSGTPITVAGTQTLADNTLLKIYGASDQGKIEGTITIKKFPSISADIYFDVDRAFVLSTLS